MALSSLFVQMVLPGNPPGTYRQINSGE